MAESDSILQPVPELHLTKAQREAGEHAKSLLKDAKRLVAAYIESPTAETARELVDFGWLAVHDGADQEAKDKAQADRLAQPTESAAARIARQEEADQVHLQRILKREQEQKSLRDSLDRDRAKLEEDRKSFALEQKSFEDYRKRLSDTEGGQQFKKALATLEGQKPKEAKEVLQALIRENKTVLWGSMVKETIKRKRPSFDET